MSFPDTKTYKIGNNLKWVTRVEYLKRLRTIKLGAGGYSVNSKGALSKERTL